MDKSKQQNFSSKVQKEESIKFGGDPSTSTLNEWAKTVPNNPVVVKFNVALLSDLLTIERFPKDTRILAKAALINNPLMDYIKLPLFCWNNCSGNGTCAPTPFFNIGTCKCDKGYTGIDCSTLTTQTPSGTLCGWTMPLQRGGCGLNQFISCDGLNPLTSCPSGYTQKLVSPDRCPNLYTCSKEKTDSNRGKPGTLCGHAGGRCGERILSIQGCPSGYNYSVPYNMCYKINGDQEDASGTWCGYGRDVKCGL